MADFITALTGAEGGITAANIWASITPIAGFIAVLVLVKLAFGLLRKTTNSATRPDSKKTI